jgi:hypothetical protein
MTNENEVYEAPVGIWFEEESCDEFHQYLLNWNLTPDVLSKLNADGKNILIKLSSPNGDIVVNTQGYRCGSVGPVDAKLVIVGNPTFILGN